MKLTRAIFLAAAFLIPTSWTVAQAGDEPAKTEEAPKKEKKGRKAKKAEGGEEMKKEGGEEAKKEEPAKK